MSKWAEIQREIHSLRQEAAEVVKVELPIGTVVAYRHGERMCYAEVIGYDGYLETRVKVVGSPSGKKFWLGIYRLIAMQAAPEAGKEDRHGRSNR